jgi:hypothetical protein
MWWVEVLSLCSMFVVPVFLCGGGSALMGNLFGPGGLMPQGVLGVPGNQLIDVFFPVAWLLSVLGFLVAPFLVGTLRRRHIRRLLNPGLDRRLRAVAEVSRWGVFVRVRLLRRIPEGEPLLPSASRPVFGFGRGKPRTWPRRKSR